jgi:trafficking protein particle complex subunit 9
MPTTASTGHLHMDYITHPPPIWHHNLSLFRPSLFPLGVIGITTCTTSTSLAALQAEFNRKVKYLYPYNSPYPLARSCFAFEESGEHTQLNAESNGLEVIPTVLGNKTSGHIGMLLAGLCSQILASFTSLVCKRLYFSYHNLWLDRLVLWTPLEAGRFYIRLCFPYFQWIQKKRQH